MTKRYLTRLILLATSLLLLAACSKSPELKPEAEVSGIGEKPEDVVFGDTDATNTIVMYASYSCTYCRYFFSRTYPQLKTNYLDKGKLKLVVKWLDFGAQPQMLHALQAASCISRFGVYDKFHELLVVNPGVVFTPEFEALVNDIMEHNELIAECILNNDNYRYLHGNVTEFREHKLSGTPAFVMKGHVYTGFRSYENLEKIMENEFQF